MYETAHDGVDDAGSPTFFAAGSSTAGDVMLVGSKSTAAVPIWPLEDAVLAKALIRTVVVDVYTGVCRTRKIAATAMASTTTASTSSRRCQMALKACRKVTVSPAGVATVR